MNIKSAKMEMVGGPLDGCRRVIIALDNVIYMHGPGGSKARVLKYVLCNDKYYFKGYEIPCLPNHERSE